MKKESWENIKILIAGGGQAGGRIAAVFLRNGIPVGIVSRKKETIQEAREEVSALLSKAGKTSGSKKELDKIFLTGQEIENILRAAQDGGNPDFIVFPPENVTEEESKKRFLEVEKTVPPRIVLARTNLFEKPENMATETLHPERVVWCFVYPFALSPSAVEYGGIEKTGEEHLQKTGGLLEKAAKATLRLKNTRPGGAGMVIISALLLESARQVEEEFDISAVEKAARSAFEINEGFLTLMDWMGIQDTVSFLQDFSRTESPLFDTYDNFFTVPRIIEKKWEKEKDTPGSAPFFVNKRTLVREPADFMMVDMLKKRFLGVAFMTASEIAGAGLSEPAAVDSFFRQAFGWKDGPFALMNKTGLEQALRLVTERMELSHRKEINFPIPRNLIDRTSENKPWPV
ncbi:MAG: hypothetical protein JXB26_19250 [Candidatus Aminicenantes bacterium]|nr:hypothetical protein [Candidatus Aminicenantes bacterium]